MEIEPKVLLENKSVAILSVRSEGQVYMMPTSWNLPISYEPPMVAVFVSHRRRTYHAMWKCTEFTLSVPYDKKLVAALSEKFPPEVDKIEKLGIKYDPETLVPQNCLGYVKSRFKEAREFGSHAMFVGDVTESRLFELDKKLVEKPQLWMLFAIAGGNNVKEWGENL